MKQLKVLTATIACLLLAAMVPGCSGEKSDAIVRTVVSERLIAQIDSSYQLWMMTTSPDARRVAYIARRDGKYFWVVDGIAGKHYDSIDTGPRLFSPDSKRVAYIAYEGKKRFSVIDYIDGEEGEGYDLPLMGPVSSPDSEHVFYIARYAKKQFFVIDGEEGKQYDKILRGSLIFSPDNNHSAYIALEGYGSPGVRYFVVLDGIEGKRYNYISGFGNLAFSPDSNHLAYVASGEGSVLVIVDGVEEEAPHGYISNFTFSPDSERLAYIATVPTLITRLTGGFAGSYKSYIFVDGKKGKTYDSVNNIHFSPDSKHIVYLAHLGRKSFVVVDGTSGKKFDPFYLALSYKAFIGAEMIAFDSPESFHYLARKGDSFYLVEETLKQE